jgi:hypothetical protein
MVDFEDLKELSYMSKKIFKDTIETSYEKFKNITNETINVVLDENEENHDYDWLEQKNSNESLEESPISKNQVYSEEQSSSKEQLDYRKNDIPIIAKNAAEEKIGLDLDLKEENLMNAIVYGEIFGKPKSKRRRRW